MENSNKYFHPYRLLRGCVVPNRLLRDPNISHGAKLLWARLAQYDGSRGKCYPSQKTLAEELGISIWQVQYYIRELKAKKLIEVEYAQGPDIIRHLTPRYHFLKNYFEEELPYEKSDEEELGESSQLES